MTTTDPSAYLEQAALALSGVLAHPEVDLLTCLAAAAALATLDDVQPPPPPLPEPIQPLTPADGIPRALTALRAAVDAAADVETAIRAGLAAHELLQLGILP